MPEAPTAISNSRRDSTRSRILEDRIRLFTSLRPEALDRLSLRRRVDEIGQVRAGAPADGGGAPAS
jgi:hypothetical protein